MAFPTLVLEVAWRGGGFELATTGTEITDATRTAALEGDGRATETSYGVWPSRTNLVANGGFETNTTGWTGTLATLSRITSEKKFGAASLSVAPTAHSGYAEYSVTISGATAGRTYVVSLWIFGTGARIGETVGLYLDEVGGAAGFARTTVSVTVLSGWNRYSAQRTVAQNDRTSMRIVVQDTSVNTDAAWYMDGVQLEQRYYATPYIETDGAAASKAVGLPTTTGTYVTFADGSIAMRVRMSQAGATNTLAASEAFFMFYANSSNYIQAYRDTTNGNFYLASIVNDVITSHSVAASHAADDTLTLIFRWTSTTLGISINGAAFTTSARTTTPSLEPTWLYLANNGPGLAYLNGDIFWAVTYDVGTLSDGNAASIHGLGNTDPTMGTLPATPDPTMIWTAATADVTIAGADIEADITADLDATAPISCAYGRDYNQPTGEATPGTLSCTLLNPNGIYSEFNSSSPYYGLIRPNLPVRLRATAPVATTVWRGYLRDLATITDVHDTPRVQLTADGPLRLLAEAEDVSAASMQDQTTGTIAAAILTAALPYEAGYRDFDTGDVTIDDWYAEPGNALELLRQVADAELGWFGESAAGEFLFWSDSHLETETRSTVSQATYSDAPSGGDIPYTAITVDPAARRIWNEITTSVVPVGTVAVAVVWTDDTDIDLEPFEEVSYTATSSDPVVAWVDPVYGTDFIIAGGETIGLVGLVKSATTMTATLRNYDPDMLPHTVGYRQARASVYTPSPPVILTARDEPSIRKYGRKVFTYTHRWLQTVAPAQAHIAELLSRWKDPRAIVTLTVPAMRSTAILTDCLTREIGDRVTLESDTATDLGVNGAFHIDAIHHDFVRREHWTTLVLSPV